MHLAKRGFIVARFLSVCLSHMFVDLPKAPLHQCFQVEVGDTRYVHDAPESSHSGIPVSDLISPRIPLSPATQQTIISIVKI